MHPYRSAVAMVFASHVVMACGAQAQCVVAPHQPNKNTYTVQTFTYEVINGQSELLDLYMPNGVVNPPLVLLLHGGGWAKGSRTDNATIAAYYTSYGYAAASIDYRLVTNGTNLFPAAIGDTRCAVRWLRMQAGTLGYKASAIGVWGGSAGGNLAGLLGAATDANTELDTPYCAYGAADVTATVQIVADYYGLNDSVDPAAFNNGQVRNFGAYLGVSNPLKYPQIAIPASAVGYINSTPARGVGYVNSTLPTYVIVHGTADVSMPLQQSIDLATALSTSGVPNYFYPVAGLPHNFSPFMVLKWPALVPSTCGMLAAFQQVLQPGGLATVK